MITSTQPFFLPQAFGAVGDGQTSDTRPLQAAIDAAGSCREGGQGGGTVYLPAGRYKTGALFFRDNVTLHLEAGATLLGSQDPAEYPVAGSRWEGAEQLTYTPLLAGNGLKNITITGRGVIDGQGNFWWRAHRAKSLPYPRPRLIGFADCQNILIEGVTLTNSPAWTINPVRCENVNVRGVTIINPPESPNTDGINPDSCRLVRISDCFVSVGDDCITIKAGAQTEQPERLEKPEPVRPCRDITITNCTLERGHGGVVIGSETSGGVQNVVVSNCVFIGTDRGIRMKSRRGRGGVVQNVRVTNIIMDGVLCPFTMNLFYHCGARGDPVVADPARRPVDAGTPRFHGIHFSHISAVGVKIAAGFLYGLPEMPVEDISFEDVSIEMSGGADPAAPEMADNLPSMAQAGLYVRNARDLRLRDVRIRGQVGKAFDFDESVTLTHVSEPFDEKGDER
jgi:polygalacturonase